MARPSTIHVCSSCGHTEASLARPVPGLRRVEHAGRGARAGDERAGARAGRRPPGAAAARAGRAITPVALRDVTASAVARLSTGIGELDRVLGGGLVPGSLVLLGGSPGIGKSTLTGMATGNIVGAGSADALRLGRGVGGPDPAAPRAAGDADDARARRAGDRRDRPRRRHRDDRAPPARGLRHRLRPDAPRARPDRRARLGRPGA